MPEAKRQTFEVVVPLRMDGKVPVSWLGLDGGETEIPDQAVRFRFHLWPNGREELAVQVRMDEINGGIGNTVDLERGLRNTHGAILRALEVQIWGKDGRPEVETDEEKKTQSESMAAAFALVGVMPADPDDLEAVALERRMAAYNRMCALRDQQEMAAAWKVLIVGPPEGWEDIAERELKSAYRIALTTAYTQARDEATRAAGK